MRFDPTALEIARICGQCDGMPDRPHVTVIVPVWNAQDMIADCLTALERQDYPSFDICVVDNGSDDATVEIVRGFAGVQLLYEPIVSSYAARNRGIASATGTYIAFTDADCIPEPGWLSAGVAMARAHPEAGMIGGRIDLFRPLHGGAVAAAYEKIFAFQQHSTLAAGRGATANWLSSRALLTRLDGFDPRLRSGGDYELCGRIRASGMDLIYAPEMIVRHPSRRSVPALAAKRRRTTAGLWQRQSGTAWRLRYLVTVPLGILYDLRIVARTPALSPVLRLGVAGTVIWLGVMQILQPLRMMLGEPAPRS